MGLLLVAKEVDGAQLLHRDVEVAPPARGGGQEGAMDALVAREGVIDRGLGHSFRIVNNSSARKLPVDSRQRLRGRPSTRSARMLRSTSEVPASIVFARERRNWYFHPSASPTCPAGPAMSTPV